MITVSLFGRGGQGIKSAARIVSTAAFLGGYYVQDQPLYGAERRGSPISAFIRISDTPILERGYISHPFYAIIADESLLESSEILRDISKDTIVFVNSKMDEERIRSKYMISNKIVTYAITDLVIDITGRAIVGVAIAAVTCKLLNLNFDLLKESLTLELKEIGVYDDELAKNIHLARITYDSIPSLKVEEKEFEEKESQIIELVYHEPSISTCTITSSGNSVIKRTGDWSIYKPVINYDKCTKCMICYVYCPDSAITIDQAGYPTINYDACKGCNICYTECPLKVITLVKRVRE